MQEPLTKLIEKYQEELDLVRQNPKRLDNFRFDKDAIDSKHFERLRLNIALYNDLRQTDYDIVKFLFQEEKEWRKAPKDGDVDNLYLSAFILTIFNSPEAIWLFFETKNIDFDSGIGFDGEYLLATGIKETYQYLATVDHPFKAQLLAYIGETEETCIYTQAEIDDWKEYKKSYFCSCKYPIQDEVNFLYSTDERELFLAKLPEWIKQEREWTGEELSLYKAYSKYTGDKALQIEALGFIIVRTDNKGFLNDTYSIELAELYVETGEVQKAFEVLKRVIEGTDNNNIVRNCVEQLCRIVIKTNSPSNEIVKRSVKLIVVQQKKYGNFSPRVNKLIKEVEEIIKEEQVTANKRHSWWQKLFGFK